MLLLAALGGAPRAAAVVVAGGEQYDAGATEIERILNIERVQAGLAALPIDTFTRRPGARRRGRWCQR